MIQISNPALLFPAFNMRFKYYFRRKINYTIMFYFLQRWHCKFLLSNYGSEPRGLILIYETRQILPTSIRSSLNVHLASKHWLSHVGMSIPCIARCSVFSQMCQFHWADFDESSLQSPLSVGSRILCERSINTSSSFCKIYASLMSNHSWTRNRYHYNILIKYSIFSE